jgi:hypothetical protein
MDYGKPFLRTWAKNGLYNRVLPTEARIGNASQSSSAERVNSSASMRSLVS